MKIKMKALNDVLANPVQMEGAKGVTVKVLWGPADNAPTFAMRVFELQPGGHTPFHTHAFEHEVFILTGQITLMNEQEPKMLKYGDTVLVLPDEKHQFKNISATEKASFICLVPIEYQK